MGTQERPFFFPSASGQLFGVLHAPVAPNRAGIGVVIVEPFGEEKLWAQRVLVSFARYLAEAGYWVLRFDCRGHGDSEGASEDATVTSRLEDTVRALEILRQESGALRIVLHGVRFGGTIAALVARSGAAVAGLALWEPIVRGESYFLECLRSNLATQMAVYKKIMVTREDLLRRLREGQPVNIDGYLVGSQFYREVAAIDLETGFEPFTGPVLAVQISRSQTAAGQGLLPVAATWRSMARRVDVATVDAEQFWKDARVFVTRSEECFAKTLGWLGTIEDAEGA